MLAIAAKGRRLDAIIDHPAFRTTGAVVGKVERAERALTLFHGSGLITVGEMERGWLACSAGDRIDRRDGGEAAGTSQLGL